MVIVVGGEGENTRKRALRLIFESAGFQHSPFVPEAVCKGSRSVGFSSKRRLRGSGSSTEMIRLLMLNISVLNNVNQMTCVTVEFLGQLVPS